MPDGTDNGEDGKTLDEKLEVKCSSDWKQAVSIAASKEGYTYISEYVRDVLPVQSDGTISTNNHTNTNE